MFLGKKITICITGCLFALKMPEIICWLRENNARVQVAISESALNYLEPKDLEKFSGNAVAIDMFTFDDLWRAIHIDIAGTDLFLIAPAEKSIIDRIAIGMADDLISAALLATSAPVLIMPDPKISSSEYDIEKEIRILSDLGYRFYLPDYGGNLDEESILLGLKAKITTLLVSK